MFGKRIVEKDVEATHGEIVDEAHEVDGDWENVGEYFNCGGDIVKLNHSNLKIVDDIPLKLVRFKRCIELRLIILLVNRWDRNLGDDDFLLRESILMACEDIIELINVKGDGSDGWHWILLSSGEVDDDKGSLTDDSHECTIWI